MPSKPRLRLNAYSIVSDAILAAIPYGINRYYKHRDEPMICDVHGMVEQIHSAIMGDISELIDWEKSG